MVRFNDVLGVMITASILIMSSGGNLPITCLQGNWKSVPSTVLINSTGPILLPQNRLHCTVVYFLTSISSRREDDPGPSCRKK